MYIKIYTIYNWYKYTLFGKNTNKISFRDISLYLKEQKLWCK